MSQDQAKQNRTLCQKEIAGRVVSLATSTSLFTQSSQRQGAFWIDQGGKGLVVAGGRIFPTEGLGEVCWRHTGDTGGCRFPPPSYKQYSALSPSARLVTMELWHSRIQTPCSCRLPQQVLCFFVRLGSWSHALVGGQVSEDTGYKGEGVRAGHGGSRL